MPNDMVHVLVAEAEHRMTTQRGLLHDARFVLHVLAVFRLVVLDS